MNTNLVLDRPAGTSADGEGPDGFLSLLHAEWTKFRTVRGWVIWMVVALFLFVFVGVFAAGNVTIGCGNGQGQQKTGRACLPYVPLGPGGEAVTDSFYFARKSLAGNATITARVTSLTGMHATGNSHVPVGRSGSAAQLPAMQPGLAPWAKAGIIVKASTKQGSAYAAMMATGSHGVRMQYDFTGDIAGLPGLPSASAPQWLRLVRDGDTITGYDSADGAHWTKVGVVSLAGLPSTVQVGFFAASPTFIRISPFFGGASIQSGPSVATAVFDHIRLSGAGSNDRWLGGAVGGRSGPMGPAGGRFRVSGPRLTLTGSGDIAPAVPGPGSGFPNATIERSLAGGFVGLIAIIAVAAMFFTAEYRRGLIRTTLAASPRRGQVLAAKAVVIGLVAFALGLVGSAVSIVLGVRRESAEGLYVLPVSALTEVRVIVGTAALLALAAVFAVAVGAVLRRSAAAITAGIAVIVLPFLLAALGIFPAGVSAWLLRITPAAGFAIQQSIPQYSQVSRVYAAVGGFYPLPPLAGFAVLCGWVAAAVILALYVLSRRDA
jgi:ABC-type transport system involved in multi-copper enzyme maturation permease subunit